MADTKIDRPNGKVLVLGHDNRAFLSVIRSLGRRNLQVHIGWCAADNFARYSRYVYQHHDIPLYSPHNTLWKDSLISLLRQEYFDLVIPCHDVDLIPLQEHRQELAGLGLIYLLDQKSFDICFDKFKSIDLARFLNIPVARGMMIGDIGQINEILNNYSFPLILKPRASHDSQKLEHRGIVRRVNNINELNHYLPMYFLNGEVLVQENFLGTGVGVELLADRGEILVAFQHVRIHEPLSEEGGLSGGGSSYRKSAPLNPILLEASRKIVAALNYRGVMMVEFKYNFDTDEYIFIEINGRFWGSLPLAIAAGVDFPYYLYQLLVEGKRQFPQGYNLEIYGRNIEFDLAWMRQNFKAKLPVPLGKIIKEFLFNIITLRERFDTLVADDLRPGFLTLKYKCCGMVKKFTSKMRSRFYSLPIIRAMATRRTRLAFQKANNILFVCKGNICRSPFAMNYAKSIFPQSAIFFSVGLHPKEGRVCPPEAIVAAKEFGLDLSYHRSATITEKLLNQVDLIFIFDEDNYINFNRHYPYVRSKIFYLGWVLDRGPVEISDPYGGDLDKFRNAYRAIKEALDIGLNGREKDVIRNYQ